VLVGCGLCVLLLSLSFDHGGIWWILVYFSFGSFPFYLSGVGEGGHGEDAGRLGLWFSYVSSSFVGLRGGYPVVVVCLGHGGFRAVLCVFLRVTKELIVSEVQGLLGEGLGWGWWGLWCWLD